MDSARPNALTDLLAELLQGYRHPAVATYEDGVVVCMNAAALGEVDRQPREAAVAGVKDWPPLATFRMADGPALVLRLPAWALGPATLPTRALPPRLAKVAALAIDGLTDRQIAQRLGLSFSTVRTYVRFIYRRMGVHNRVGLVHAARAQSEHARPNP